MRKITKEILKTIKEKHIQPKPRWHFLMIHGLLWMAVITAIVIGGFSCGVVIRHFLVTDWELVERLTEGPLESFIIVLPYLWFLLLGIILFLAKWLFTHTEKGYKIRPSLIVLISMMISIAGGLLTFSIHLDEPFEQGFRRHMPFYTDYVRERSRHFVNPARGVLAGHIIEVFPNEELVVVDFREEKWRVDIHNINHIPEFIVLEKGWPIGILGKKTAPSLFRAEKLLAPPPFNLKNERKFLHPSY